MSDSEATETQFKSEPSDLFKKCSQRFTYTLSLTGLIDLLTFLVSKLHRIQNCIKFKEKIVIQGATAPTLGCSKSAFQFFNFN